MRSATTSPTWLGKTTGLCSSARGNRVLDERRGNPPDQAENRGARTPSVLLTLHNPIRNMDSMPDGVPEAAELKDETRALPSADKSSTRP